MKILRCLFTLIQIGVLSIILSGVAGDCNTYQESPSEENAMPSEDTTAPILIGGTVKDGEEDVDYEAINEGKTIEVTFSEDVSGNITLQTEGGDHIGWIGIVEGTKGTLELVPGKEIAHKTTYVIKGKVTDAAGNETEVSISFTTKDKA